MISIRRISLGALIALTAANAAAGTEPIQTIDSVTVSARLRAEPEQDVPIAISAIDAATLERLNISNLSQATALLPSVNYSSPNPRNTAFTIRGLGSSVVAVSQANDGLEPGVGFYVDGVYHARPATAAFDFVDIDHVEILRGPQGTLFGKNTTAGAILMSSRLPTFSPEGIAEFSMGEQGFMQAKAALSGPLINDTLAARMSASVTLRDGVLKNVRTGDLLNNVNNTAFRGQLLAKPNEMFSLRIVWDYTSFSAECCTQVFVAVAPTLKAPSRQYAALAAGLQYAPPSQNPYSRETDIDAPVGASTNEGGLAATATWEFNRSTVTSISAWRYWNWDAANDRDYTGIQVQTLQHIPSRQDQYSEEIRMASKNSKKIEWLMGIYGLKQKINGEPISQYGAQATYWLLGPVTTNAATTYPPNLLDGYGTDGHTKFSARSAAAFAEASWHLSRKVSLTAGLRYTDENKSGDYNSFVYGGLKTSNARLLKAQLSILRPQSYSANVADGSTSGRANVTYRITDSAMTYIAYADTQKSGGINMSGLPLDAANQPALSTAVIKPERNRTVEVGAKTKWLGGRIELTADIFQTTVRNFQTNVVDTGPGALRGYLANIEKVRVRGLEIDSHYRLTDGLSLRASANWTDGRYLDYRNGPCPIERIGSATTVCDLSGKSLSGLPHVTVAYGAEYLHKISSEGTGFANLDAIHRGAQYGDPTDSQYTLLPKYDLLNAQVGWRGEKLEAYAWIRNLTNSNYLQNVTVQAGNSGLIVGTPSDPRAFGITVRARL